jgi:hypothetical protein
MPTILPMAVVTLVASAALWIAVLWAYSGRTWRFVPLVAFGLPLSALVNLAVKGPLAEGVGARAGIDPGRGLDTPLWFLLFLFTLAPVFEEAIKVVPVVVPGVRRAMAGPGGALWTGFALGIGFGLGEAAYLAWQVAASGAYEQYPWYAFTGFLGERFVVVYLHGFMTGLFLWMAGRGKRVLGYLAAIGVHGLLNSGAMLYQLGLAPGWAAGAVMVGVLVAAVLVFDRVRPRADAFAPPDARSGSHETDQASPGTRERQGATVYYHRG